jgi:hypothetical protein
MTMTGTGSRQNKVVTPPTLTTGPRVAHRAEYKRDAAPLEGAVVSTLAQRQLSAGQWLLTAAEDRDAARAQWQEQGLALLACGGVFSAVRAPAHLVWAAAGTDDLMRVDAHLQRWFDGGAVFMDLYSAQYYFLVPAATAWRVTDRKHPGVECLGRGTYLGVPAPHLTQPRGRSYWSVPMGGPGALCYADEVEQLLAEGRASCAEGNPR